MNSTICRDRIIGVDFLKFWKNSNFRKKNFIKKFEKSGKKTSQNDINYTLRNIRVGLKQRSVRLICGTWSILIKRWLPHAVPRLQFIKYDDYVENGQWKLEFCTERFYQCGGSLRCKHWYMTIVHKASNRSCCDFYNLTAGTDEMITPNVHVQSMKKLCEHLTNHHSRSKLMKNTNDEREGTTIYAMKRRENLGAYLWSA